MDIHCDTVLMTTFIYGKHIRCGLGTHNPVSLLQIVAEEVSGTNDYVQLSFRAHKLDNKVGTPESMPH